MKLPLIDRPIDNTALSTYMRCPREYKLSMIEGWRSKERRQALSFGAFWHRLMETHYKTGGDSDRMLEVYSKYKHEVPDTGDYRTADRAWVEYGKYKKVYPPKVDCATTVGYPEAPMVEIAVPVVHDNLVHEYAGKIDRIIVLDGLGYIEDHKTTSRFDKGYFRQFQNSNQMMGYHWIGQQLVPDIKIVGARINLLHVLTSKSDFHREIVTFPPSIIKEWESNTNQWLHRIERSIESNDFPGHYGDDGCTHRFGRCQFFDVCNSSPRIREALLQQDFEVRHWDPLSIEEGGGDD